MIRPMREEDLKQAADLEKRYFSLPWSEKTLRESLERQEYVFLVAEEEGQIAGYAGLLQVMEEGDITNVVVDESCRGRGLGRGLVSRLLEEGKARGIRAFTLRYGWEMQALSGYMKNWDSGRKACAKGFMTCPKRMLLSCGREKIHDSNLLFLPVGEVSIIEISNIR